MESDRSDIEAFEGASTGVRGVHLPSAWNDLTQAVIGAAMRVHTALGPGLPERVYAAALHVELRARHIPFGREVPICVRYAGESVGDLRLDLVVDGLLVIELKALESVHDLHLAQLVSYLRAGNFPLGLLLNFNVPRLKDGVYRRVHSAAIASRLIPIPSSPRCSAPPPSSPAFN